MYERTRNISDIHSDNRDPDPAIGTSHIEGMGKGTGFDIGKIQRNQRTRNNLCDPHNQ